MLDTRTAVGCHELVHVGRVALVIFQGLGKHDSCQALFAGESCFLERGRADHFFETETVLVLVHHKPLIFVVVLVDQGSPEPETVLVPAED